MGTSGNSEMKSWKKMRPRLQPQRIQIIIRDMKTHPTTQTFGCFDVELRVQWLEVKGNPLSWLDAVIDKRVLPALHWAAAQCGGHRLD